MAYCGPRGIPLSQFLEWDPADQDAALAWQARESRRCGSCGTHPDEWDERSGGRRDAYAADVLICPGCRTLDAKRAQENGKPPIHGAHLALIRAERR